MLIKKRGAEKLDKGMRGVVYLQCHDKEKTNLGMKKVAVYEDRQKRRRPPTEDSLLF